MCVCVCVNFGLKDYCFSRMQDVDVVVTFPPSASEATVLWFKGKLDKIKGLRIQTKSITLSCGSKTKPNCYAFHISATYQG